MAHSYEWIGICLLCVNSETIAPKKFSNKIEVVTAFSIAVLSTAHCFSPFSVSTWLETFSINVLWLHFFLSGVGSRSKTLINFFRRMLSLSFTLAFRFAILILFHSVWFFFHHAPFEISFNNNLCEVVENKMWIENCDSANMNGFLIEFLRWVVCWM